MKPAKLDFTIYQGTTWIQQFIWEIAEEPADLDGCTARMYVRKTANDPKPVLILTTENNKIELGNSFDIVQEEVETEVDGETVIEIVETSVPSNRRGLISIFLTAEETEKLNFRRAIYDMEIIFPGGEIVQRILQGNISVSFEITHERGRC